MAEEHASMTGPNGERLELRVGSKSIGLQAQSLVSILLLLALGGAGYLVWQAVQQRFDLMQSVLVRILERQATQDQLLDAHLSQMQKWIRVHDWNQSRDPADRLPLDLDPAQIPPKKPVP